MTTAVMENLELLAGAPGGIATLRRLIRDLATGGSLIADARSSEWLEVRLAELVLSFQNGVSSRGAAEGTPVTVLRLADIKNGSISLEDTRQLMLDDDSIRKYRLAAGDVLVIRVNGSADLVGRLIVCESSVGLHCDHFIRLRLDVSRIDPAYLKLVGDSTPARSAIQDLFVSTAGQKTVNQTHIGSLSFALPPLAEQHRIVAKVDELMALCDRLEARQQDADAAHSRLVQALLDSLTQACDAEEFQACWRRLSGQFQISFTTVEAVDKLKQVIRDVAVSGRLLAGNSGGASWEWSTLGAEVTGMDSGWSPACLDTPSQSEEAWGVLRTTAVQRLEYVQAENKALPSHLEPRPEAEVRAGDILFTRAGPMNRVAISCLVDATRPRLMLSDKIIRFRPKARVVGNFMALCLNAGKTAEYLEQAKSGMAASQVNISQAKLKAAPIPVPPLDEQRRVVAKVTELLTLCDQLKARIAAARAKHAQLAEALVAQAVAT